MYNTKDRRILITCSRCSKEKRHFGLGMCSPCLRRTKRETRPEFYLGTCYSEMSRRVKTFDPLRPKYFGKSICSKEAFMGRFLNDKEFLTLFSGWRKSLFKRKFSPTIDRIDNSKGYDLSNLRFISHRENSTKDVKKVTILVKDCAIIEVDSCTEAGRILGVSTSFISKCRKKKKLIGGWRIYEL